MFLTLSDPQAGFTMKYPEGWAQLGASDTVTIRDKNNLVRIVVRAGAAPTVSAVATEIASLVATNPNVKSSPARAGTINGAPAIKVSYTTQSAPNPVTGKSVTLVVDRYYLSHAGKVAVVDLGTPTGVDNIDAYRMMIASFRWK